MLPEQWIKWSNIYNEAEILENSTDPQVKRFVTKNYQITGNAIQINTIRITAFVLEGEIKGVTDIHKQIHGKIYPLSDNVALTDFKMFSNADGVKLNMFFPGYAQYLWFPEGMQTIKDSEYVKFIPEQNLIHLHWLRHNLFIFKVRVPDKRAPLNTFYPEQFSQFAFSKHPDGWFGYWQYDDGPAILYNFNTDSKLYAWTNKPLPPPENFIEFLAKRLTKTLGGSYKSIFLQRAV